MSAATAVENFVELQVVYNGQPKHYRANVHQTLRPIFQRALADFGLQPAQPDNYGLVLQGQSQPLALDAKVEDLGLPENAVLILQQRTPPRGG
jgi:Protein of Unknown function (DUF2604)